MTVFRPESGLKPPRKNEKSRGGKGNGGTELASPAEVTMLQSITRRS
jgi:hypothetical protein